MRRVIPLAALLAIGCARAPSPLAPHYAGSIGTPSKGVLTKPAELPADGAGYRTLAANERHFGTPRFVAAIERAAAKVAHDRPGSVLTVGDLSARTGGHISSHASHRTGRDADLLLYMTTLEGAPVTSTSFVNVGTDGLAWDERGNRFLRFDVEREWLLVKALVEDPAARIQWLFVSKPVEAMLVEWARARGESGDTIVRAMDAMLQPGPPAQSHDDHIHVRTACDPDEIAAGCEPTGPVRPWIAAVDAAPAVDLPTTMELVQSLVLPIDAKKQRVATDLLVRADARDLAAHVTAGSADLAYLDPPFKVEKSFGARMVRGPRARGPIAYDDTWASLEAYLGWLEERVAVAHGLLSPRGTLWLHLDSRAVHEAKLVCDRVFGARKFRGEVVWVPGNGSKSKSGPGMGHQTLLLYARGKDPIWNGKDPALRAPFAATSQAMHFQRSDEEGRRYRDRVVSGKTYRYYADEGRAIGSVWTDCPAMAANTPLMAETTGYPTQKPLKLLDRVVRATSDVGSLVVDLFAGSGTTLVAAAQAKRRFAGCDVGKLAIATTRARLDAAGIRYRFVTHSEKK